MTTSRHTRSPREVGFFVEAALSPLSVASVEWHVRGGSLRIYTTPDPLHTLRDIANWTQFVPPLEDGVFNVPADTRKVAVEAKTHSASNPSVVTVISDGLTNMEQARIYGVDQLDSPITAPPFPPFVSAAKDFNIIDIRNTAGPWGQTDGRLGTVSYWIKNNVTNQENGFIWRQDNAGGATGFEFHKDGLERAVLTLKTAAGGVADMEMSSDQNLINEGVWSHVMASWNYSFPADPANNATLFVDGVQQLNGVGFAVITQNGADADLAYATKGETAITGHAPGIVYLDACLSNVYINVDERVDLTDPANRLLFYGPAGESVGHGADGSFPTGNQPFFYAPDGDTRVNVGYGPQLVQTGGGTITDCNDAPVGFVP